MDGGIRLRGRRRSEGTDAVARAGQLPPPPPVLFATTDPQALVPLLRAIDVCKGTHVVKCAFMTVPLLVVRPGMLGEADLCRGGRKY